MSKRWDSESDDDDWSIHSKDSRQPNTKADDGRSTDADDFIKPGSKGLCAIKTAKNPSSKFMSRFSKIGAAAANKESNLSNAGSTGNCIDNLDSSHTTCASGKDSDIHSSDYDDTLSNGSKADLKSSVSLPVKRPNGTYSSPKSSDGGSVASMAMTEPPSLLDILPHYSNRGFFGTGKLNAEASESIDGNGSLTSKCTDNLAKVQCDGRIAVECNSLLEDQNLTVQSRTFAELRRHFGEKFTFRLPSPPKIELPANPRMKQYAHLPLNYPDPVEATTSAKPKYSNEEMSQLRRGKPEEHIINKEQRCSINGFPRRPLGFHMLPSADKDSNGEEVDKYGRFLISFNTRKFASGDEKGPPSRIFGCTYFDGDKIVQDSTFEEQLIVVSHELQFANTESERHIWRAIGTETFKGVVELAPNLINPAFSIDIGTWFSAILEYVQHDSKSTKKSAYHLRCRKINPSKGLPQMRWAGEIPNSNARECYTGCREWLQVRARLVSKKEYSPYMKSDLYGYVSIPEKVHGVVCDVGNNVDFYDSWIQPLWEPIVFESSRDSSVCWEAVSLKLVASVTPEEM